MVNNVKRKIGKTIPFGYKELKNNKLLYPIKSQLNALKETKLKILDGTISLRAGAIELENKTGRSLSYVGLNKIISKDYPNWQIKANKGKIKIINEKKKLIELEKKKLREEKELEKLRKRELKKIKYRNCIICNEKKLLEEFKKNKSKYCNNCRSFISIRSPKLYLNCSICKKRKNINELAGLDGFNAYKRKTCKPCYKEILKKWELNNKEKRKIYKKRYEAKYPELIKKRQKIYLEKNKEKINKRAKIYLEKNKEKIKLKNKLRFEKLKKNKEKYAEYVRKRKEYANRVRLKNPEQYREKEREYYKKTREKRIQSVLNWKKRNMDKVTRNRIRHALKSDSDINKKKSLW